MAVGINDVKSYYIETADDVAERVRRCLKYAPPERLAFAPDCGQSQTARWAARQKLVSMVTGVKKVRAEMAYDSGGFVASELLADISGARIDRDAFHLWWLGQSGFLIHWQDRFLLMDPYLSDSLTAKYANYRQATRSHDGITVRPEQLDFVHVVTSSHHHTDHLMQRLCVRCSPSIKYRDCRAGSHPRFCGTAGLQLSPHPVAHARRWPNAGCRRFLLHAVASAHETVERDEQGRCRYLGYIVRFGRWTIYHSGDTVRYDGMAETLETWNIDVALLPINGRAPERRVPGNLWDGEAMRSLATRISGS